MFGGNKLAKAPNCSMVSGISQANDGTAVSPNEGVVVDALMMFSKTSLVSSGPPDRQDPNFRRSLGVRSSQGFSPWGGYFFHFLTLKTRTEFMGILEVQQYNKDTQRWRPCYKTAQTLRQFSGSVFFLGGVANYQYYIFLEPPSILTNRVLPQILLLPIFVWLFCRVVWNI